MIEINKLTQSDIGRNVIYHREFCDREVGKLSSWNDKYIFVRFKGPYGESCQPEDISFELQGSNEASRPYSAPDEDKPLLPPWIKE